MLPGVAEPVVYPGSHCQGKAGGCCIVIPDYLFSPRIAVVLQERLCMYAVVPYFSETVFMRIAHFMYDHRGNPWLGGGGAVREWEINRRLVERGHEIHVYCGAVPGQKMTDWVEDGVHYHSCGVGVQYAVSRLSFNCTARGRWNILQKQTPFDLIVEDTSPFTMLPAVRREHVPAVAIIQNFMGKRLIAKMGPIGRWFAAHERSLQKRYRHYITVSRFLSDAVKQQQPDAEVTVVYNGIDDVAFIPRTTDKVPGQLLFLGRIDRYHKGLDLLLTAFEQLSKDDPDLSLVIAGGGRDEAWLRNEIAVRNNPRIRWTGRLGPERFDLLAQSELLVMPSRFEGWGITAVEAAAVGTPVVGTLVDGLMEAVDNGVTGELVAPDADALVRCISGLMRDPSRRARMGAAGKLRAANFRWDILSKLQDEAYVNCARMSAAP